MPSPAPTYHSRLFRDFKGIAPEAYREIVRFYEAKEEEIKRLDFEEYFELLTTYVNALFETGKYRKHLTIVGVVIELTIHHNIGHYHGVDLFRQMLFRKAASHYHNFEFDEACHILRELIRMDARDMDAARFLKRCLHQTRPAMVYQIRAAGIFLLIMSAFIIGLEILFVRPFYRMHIPATEATRNAIFLLGCSMLAAGELFHRWRVNKRVNQFVRELHRRPQRKIS